MRVISKYFFTFLIFAPSLLLGQSQKDILPIQLIYFEASLVYNGVLLRWGTATEVNNFGFEIQRADSSLQFVGIDFVPGSGNSNSPKHYFYIDSTLTESGLYYYRLNQIDIDGTSHLTDTINIYFQMTKVYEENSAGESKILVSNNQNLKELTIELKDLSDEEISFQIYSILGERIEAVKIYPYQQSLKINYKYLPSGVYFLVGQRGNKIITTFKFISLR